jgi:hypothetical protein
MFPSCNQFLKTLVLVVVLGYLLAPESSEARGLEDQQQDDFLNYSQGNLHAQQQLETSAQRPMLTAADVQNLDRLDSDDEDDDDDRIQQAQPDQPQQISAIGSGRVTSGSDLYQTDQSYQPPYQPAAQDLKPAASKHYGHHKHGAKGWLDMGAWTGKKGAFGWYDKHPVGKGRK